MKPTPRIPTDNLQDVHDLPDALLPLHLILNGLKELRAHEPHPALDAALVRCRGPVLPLDALDLPAADHALHHVRDPGLVGEEPGVALPGPVQADPPRHRHQERRPHLRHVAEPAHLERERAARRQRPAHPAEEVRLARGRRAEDPVHRCVREGLGEGAVLELWRLDEV